jgi:hypothetical protein
MKRKNKMRQQRLILFIFFIPAFLPFGCTNTFNINNTEIGNYPQPLIEPLPINVGVYYGNDFRTYKTIQENYFADGWARISKIQLGGANIALFDYILSHIFNNVTSIQHFPIEPENSKNIDLILEPTIIDYIYGESESADYVTIKYRINFYSPDGLQISTWSISG